MAMRTIIPWCAVSNRSPGSVARSFETETKTGVKALLALMCWALTTTGRSLSWKYTGVPVDWDFARVSPGQTGEAAGPGEGNDCSAHDAEFPTMSRPATARLAGPS